MNPLTEQESDAGSADIESGIHKSHYILAFTVTFNLIVLLKTNACIPKFLRIYRELHKNFVVVLIPFMIGM